MYTKKAGYFKLFKVHEVEVLAHWSFPIGGLLIAAYFNSNLVEVLFYIISYILLVFAHEIGHLLAAKYYGLEVHAIEITGDGGRCHTEAPKSYKEAFLLYSGGLIAQAVLFMMVIIYLLIFNYPKNGPGHAIIITFTVVNIFVFIVSLIPGKGVRGSVSDGHVLWNLAKSYYGKA